MKKESKVPEITPEQRTAALDAARAARKARAGMLEEFRRGEISLDEVMRRAGEDKVVARTKVRALLLAVPGVGEAKADGFMREAGIGEGRRLGGLGSRQREALRAFVEGRGL